MNRFDHLKKEYEEVLMQLSLATDSKERQRLGRRQAELLPMVEAVTKLEQFSAEITEHNKLIAEGSDLAEMAKEELPRIEEEKIKVESQLKAAMLPKDPYHEKNIIIEIRAGAGGDESGLFAAELFRMYSKFAEKLGYKVAIASSSRTSLGGCKEVIFEILGIGAYSKFKYESGVHRVQ